MPKRDASGSRKARLQEIIDTSARLFAQNGYHATTINNLCDANNLGKGSFYYYISSKEELLAGIHDRVMDELMDGADRVSEVGGSPSSQLVLLGEELLDVIHRYPDHVWVFLHDFPALTGERAKRFRERRREYMERLESVLQAGIEAGEFHDLDLRVASRAWLGMHHYTYLWLRPGGSPKDLAKQFAELFLRGAEIRA
jgi:AcrR family transcriptional regulator